MLDPKHPFSELLRRDTRYKFEAYLFVFDALRYGQEEMGLGMPSAEEAEAPRKRDTPEAQDLDKDLADLLRGTQGFGDEEEPQEDEHHVSGQQLCYAIQRYAIEQYGLLAQSVLKHWGVKTTNDFGEIVFNLIDIGQMRKTDEDRREDFNDVFEFSDAFSNREVFSIQHCSIETEGDEESQA